MIDVKDSFKGGLDLDTSFYKMRKDSYCDALNITRDAVASNQDDIVSNIIGNRIFNYSLPVGTNKNIGSYANTVRNTVISFVYNSNLHHSVIEYDFTTRTSARIFESLLDSATDILGFTIDGKITGINIYNRDEGDLLFFLDSLGRPTVMNITRFKLHEYSPVTRDIIDVGKRPPLTPPDSNFSNDTTRVANNFFKKEARFRSRWIYDDNEKSTPSPIGAIPLPVNILDPAYTNIITNNNLVNIFLNSGPQNVKAVELWLSVAESSDIFERFVLAQTINKSDIKLSAVATGFPSGTTTRETIVFSGYVAAGTVINIYLTLLPNTQTLVGTYTTLSGDSITSIVNGLISSITGIGIGTLPSQYGSSGLYFDFNNTIYSFSQVQINAVNTNVDNVDFTVGFYNDSTYPFISDAESLQLFDYVPDNAVAQEEPNGNVLAYGNITEGYNRDLVPNVTITVSTVAAGSGGAVGTLNAVATNTSNPGSVSIYNIVFSGIPATGTVVKVNLITTPGGIVTTVATYTTLPGDLPLNVAIGLGASMTAIGIATVLFAGSSGGVTNLSFDFPNSAYDFNQMVITPPNVSTANNSVATWKWSTERNVGISYYDQKGKTNGMLYNAKVTFPPYAENGSQVPLLPFINIKIYHVPPIWAYSYQIDFTKEPTRYLWIQTIDVNATESDYLYFDITNLALNQTKKPTTAAVINWPFQDGDRFRLIRRMSDGHVYGSTFDTFIEGIVTAPTISNVVQTGKTFVKIKKIAPFAAEVYTTQFFVIELYRPGQQPPNNENAVYFECGIQGSILNPTTDQRVHSGQVTNQSTDYVTPAELNIYKGDSYFRSRTEVLSETGGVGIFNVQDRNFVDFYISAVSSIDGRPLAIEINERQATYGALIRHSEEYEADTNVNGLNRFYANNFLNCDASFGGIMRLSVISGRRIMKVFQSNKTGRIFLFNQISKDQNGNAVMVVTDKLLNPIEYYIGNYGIGTARSSLVSFKYADYFIDNIRGAILRASEDGVDVLSLLYNVNSWAIDNLPLRSGTSHAYGGFDQKSNNYIIALEQSGSSAAQTLAFAEENRSGEPPSFESFISLFTEGMGTIGTLLCAFKDGALWSHDNTRYNSFFGVDYESSITPVFNDNVLMGKSYQSLEEISNTKWDCPIIITQSNSYGTTPQQSNLVEAELQLLEGKYCSSFKRDSNSRGGKINGDSLKGNFVKIKFRKQNASDLVTLNLAQVFYIESNLNKR